METNQIILQGTTSQQLIEDLKNAFREVLEDSKPQTNSSIDKQLMTREEVCDLLQINKSTLWKRTKTGKIPSYGQGRRIYYKRSEVMESLTPLKK
ncbi:helix-turn-helix domain-containing protein [Leeuwenhoekiella aequorea]|uniref:Excisionase family DNA binding protein n=1 Tax=Leeuwenhoekiella aequorea TaxID=283736 RepID=A0A4Q0P3A4_9FLAO|nr:helix-turn-helix domain-containing protein [Leeuwenhoekiella aequorea]RXG21034.1 excisionase family DNA binding protein [Leeuwenhoekiella aequorea]|tara:strand:+ start:5155 stop:5439 length:285 start_codon:yes stop_codon:yes gene_type:complete